MARLLKAQREYLQDRISSIVHSKVKEAHKRLAKNSLLDNVSNFGASVDGVRFYAQSPFNGEESVCGARENFLKNKLKYIDLPHSWFEEEYKKGNYTVEFDFKDCGTGQPKGVVKFTNYEKAIKALHKKEKRALERRYDNTYDAVSEMNYIKLESNKLLQSMMDDIMLGDEPAVLKAVQKIEKEMDKIIK